MGGSRTSGPVDVVTSVVIRRPPAQVAAYTGDPSNAPRWYVNISSVDWQTPPPMKLGSKLKFTAKFLGRRLTYVYEVRELIAGQRLVMRTAQGPFPMETTYLWEPAEHGATRMTLRNRGEPTGFSRLAAPLMASAMRRANEKDLRMLKAQLEGESQT
ncbi:MAG: ATPase [Chloroflexi bacterium]|nr:MAG: ATPase [Chloroflexota bacterium]